MLLGKRIKELRAEHGVLQRQLAALLEIDTPMFSKIERGDRRAKRTQVIQLAEYFKIDKNELLVLTTKREKAETDFHALRITGL